MKLFDSIKHYISNMIIPSSVTSVSPVSGKFGLAPVWHTLNTGSLVLRDQHQYHLQYCIERLGFFLMPLLCVGPSVRKCHRHVKFTDMSDERTAQSMRTTLFFADSSGMCSGIVILVLELSLVFTQKGRTTGLNTSSTYT